MMTLRRFVANMPAVPMATAWYLADLAEAKGRQQLFTRQSPQRLKELREHAMIESAVSSNRIEGVEIDASRVRAVVLGRPALRDRNEEEVRGYRDALRVIHHDADQLAVSEEVVLELHRLSRGQIGDAGTYKEKDVDILETYPGVSVSVDMIRHVLKGLRGSGAVECLGRGRSAMWRRVG